MTYKSLEHTILEARKARQREAMFENIIFETELDEVITNSNSCGQGHDDEHRSHEYHQTILKHGYNYSHSTPIRQRDGSTVNHHTYKHMNNQDKNVSVSRPKGTAGSHLQWATSTSGLGRGATSGFSNHTLEKHLKGRKIAKKTTPDDLGHRENRVSEEVETVDEISKEKLQGYVKKASTEHGMANFAKRSTTDPDEKKSFANTEVKRKKGISKAIGKLDQKEEVETIDELSNKKLAPYMRKASKDLDFYHKQKIATLTSGAELPKVDKQIEKRQKGNGLALRKALKNSGISLRGEEVERIDELSKKTLGSYIKQASHELPSKEMEVDDIYKHGYSDKHGQPDDKKKVKVRADLDNRERNIQNRHAGIDKATDRLTKEQVVDELAPMVDPNKAKMDAQRMQLQKQRDALKMQIQKQKGDRQMQAAKAKGQEEIQKIKEDELSERQVMRVRTFGRAAKLQNLHNRQYNRLSANGNLAQAEAHRKRAMEYKRIAYTARDNPGRLPTD